MTPQELMDMPGAGNAEKQLRSTGSWDITALEVLQNIPEDEISPKLNEKIEYAIEVLEDLE